MNKKQVRLLKALNFSILDFFIRKKEEPKVQESIAKKPTRTKNVTYKGIKWEDVKLLQDTSSFKQVEKLLGVKLPKELIDLIVNCNGGSPTPCIFDTQRTMGHVFQALFSYNPDDEMNIFFVIENDYDNTFRKHKIIPIGDSANGDTICLNRKGQVFRLDHETWKFDDEDIIAPSINLLLEDAGLYDSDDYIKHYKKYLTMCYNSISLTMVSYMGEYELMAKPHNNTNEYGHWLRALYNHLRDVMNILPRIFDRCNNNAYKNEQKWHDEHLRTFKLPPDTDISIFKPNISFELEGDYECHLVIIITYYIADKAGKGATKHSFQYDLKGNLEDESVETKKQPK